ncbi:iron chaperone [Haploplasma axanthum]|uniref:Uncharacterized conserved protein n=1 Tax=Haploplasma axanthum TaxID=29552 RepID=A0A449BEJ0_HAPAX|nr:DUF1801 domain-containing protein [Haploplasma axanthum]VEU80842.1 Uncharacterized conserved protein [Haploplasma axanthum]
MKWNNVSEYLNTLPIDVKTKLEELRKFVLSLDKRIEESISYNMPTYKIGKPVFYFYAYEKHIGIYPLPDSITHFSDKLTKYKKSKGAFQIPIDQDIPFDLIKELVTFNINNLK